MNWKSLRLLAAITGFVLFAGADYAAAQLITVKMPTLATGSTAMINMVIAEKGFDKKNGLNIDFNTRSSIPAYYADYRLGRMDAMIGGVGNVLSDRLKGSDSTIIGTQSPTAAFFLTRNPALKDVTDLKGKKIAGPVGSGNFLLAVAMAQLYGFDLRQDTQLANVPGPAGGPTQLAAGRTDVAFSWEPVVTTFMNKNPDMRILVDVRKAYLAKAGHDSHVIVLTAHEGFLKKHPGVEAKLVAAYRDGANFFTNDLEAALEIIKRKTGKGVDAIRDAFLSGRLSYSTKPAEEEREMLMTMAANLVKAGLGKSVPPGMIYQP